MAIEKLEIVLSLVTGNYKKEAKEAATATSGISGAARGVTDSLRSLVGPAAIGSAIAVLKEWTAAAVEDQEQQAILANVMRNTVDATEEQIGAGEEWISTMQRQTGVADSELRPALARLLTSGLSVEDSQKHLATAMDIATASGKPLGAVVEAIGKAANGTVGSLGRLGIVVRDNEGKMLTFEEAMAGAAETMGGSMAEAAATAAGQARIAKVAFDELAESVGAQMIKPTGLFAIQALRFMDDLSGMSATAAEAKSILSTLALQGIDPLADKVASAAVVIQTFTDRLADGAVTYGLVDEAIGVLRSDLQLSVEDWNRLRQAVADGTIDLGLSAEAVALLVSLLQAEQVALSSMHPAAHRPAEVAALNDQVAAQLRLNDSQLASLSSTFAVANAANGVADAHQAYVDAILKTGLASEETERAALRLGEAELRLDAASRLFAEEGGPAGVAALEATLLQAGVAKTVIDDLIESILLYNTTPVAVKSFTGRVGHGSGLQEFASGGIVPGRRGEPMMAIIHGGEMIIPPGQGGFAGGMSNVTNNKTGPTIIVNSPTNNLRSDLQYASIMARVTNLVEGL